MLVAGVLTVLGGLTHIVRTARFIASARRAVATVVGVETVELSEGHGYRPVVELEDEVHGRRRQPLGVPSSTRDYEAGEQFPVLYSSADGRLVKDTFFGRWGWGVAAVGAGAAMTGAGGYFALVF